MEYLNEIIMFIKVLNIYCNLDTLFNRSLDKSTVRVFESHDAFGFTKKYFSDIPGTIVIFVD